MVYFIILLLTLLNGFFSMSEIAVVSSRKFKLETNAKKGNRGSAIALKLSESPNAFLSTVQIGITLIGILLGIYSGENLTKGVEEQLNKVDLLRPYASSLSVVAVLIPVTFLSIVLGELLPKRIGLTFPEAIASFIARPMAILSKLTSPFVWLLTSTNDLLLRLLGIRADYDGLVTEEEIKSIISESTESGEIQEIEQDIVERVFSMGDRNVSALMTHRSDLVWLDASFDLEAVKQRAGKTPYSVYPVASKNLDNVKGIVMLKDLFVREQSEPFELEKFLRQPLYVPTTIAAYKVLEDMKKEKKHHALILDEYGSVQGMVTMDDILDALVGDAGEETDQEYTLREVDTNRWEVDGPFAYFEFVNYFDLDVEDDHPEYNTMGGFITHQLQRLPKVGDRIVWMGISLEVLAMEKRRVKTIAVSKKKE